MRRVATLMLALASLAIAFLIAEVAFRFSLFGLDALAMEKINSVHSLGESGLIRASNERELIYELKPELDTLFKFAALRTNAEGLRDESYALAKPAQTFRVAVLGDSFTMPSGLEVEEAYHSLLEEWLNRREGEEGWRYEFINFGIGGYGLRQYPAVLKLRADAYDPDLVLIGFCPENDHFVPSGEPFERPFEAHETSHPFYGSFVAKGFRRRLYVLTNTAARDEPFTSEQRDFMAGKFSEMKRHADRRGYEIVVVHLHYLRNERYAADLESLVVASGLRFTDVSPAFGGEDLGRYRIYPTDHHPNAEANRIFAEQLRDYLDREKLTARELGVQVGPLD